jgi:hypothetical protein
MPTEQTAPKNAPTQAPASAPASAPAPAATAATTAGETKAAKFKRLAEARVAKAMDAISTIGGLAAKNNYDYTDEQVTKIEAALQAEIVTLMNRFRKPNEQAKTGFTL